MPPIVIPPLVKVVLAALGTAAIVRWAVKEAQRINAELERMKAQPATEPLRREALPTLRRDPATGQWRLM